MERERVVTVEGPDGPGSGYVIGPRLVLTSAHVVGRATTVRLYRPGEEPLYDGVVVWCGTPGERDDAALVLVDDGRWYPPGGAKVRWGRLATSRPRQKCETWGTPAVAQRPGRATEAGQQTGRINPGSGFVGNHYVVRLDDHPPEPTGAGLSPWAGLSGAALFCGGMLIGVVASDMAYYGHSALRAVPAYVLHHDATFRAALDEHGAGSTALGLVEFQDLVEKEPPRPAGGLASPAALLTAERQVVDFHGREELLHRLTAWCEQAGFGAWLLHGPGGQGKTRVAHELARRLARRPLPEGWTVLWPRANAAPTDLAALWEVTGPLLVVLDYAETRLDELSALLAAAEEHAAPFRLLLLSRTAGDWWNNAKAAHRIAEELLDGAPVVGLPPLEAAPADRPRTYRRAAEAFAAALPGVSGHQRPDWPALARALPVPVLDRAGFDNALTLQMTALADLLDTVRDSADDPPDAAPPTTTGEAADVEERMLVHERRYWLRNATAHRLRPPLTDGALEDALAAALLVGADDREQAAEVLRRVPSLADQGERREAVRSWITATYPPTGPGPWGALQPDRLAEHLVGRRVQADHSLAHRLVPALDRARAARFLTLLTRAGAHPPLRGRLDGLITDLCTGSPALLGPPAVDVATQVEAPEPLLTALHRLSDDPDTPLSDLESLADRVPLSSYHLAPLAVRLLERIVAAQRASGVDGSDRTVAFATRLRELSKRLMDVGEPDRALAAAEEAVGLLSRAASPRTAAARTELAAAWNNAGVCLRALGRRREALAAATEAVGIHRRLAATGISSDAILSNHVQSLNSLSDTQRQLGDAPGALETGREAVGIREGLVRSGAEGARANLALDLNNLAIHCLDTGQREEALETIDRALEILRPLAEEHPDTFRPALAVGLNTRSNCLSEMGRWEEALEAVRQSTAIRRRLAEGRPNAFGPGLAMTLNTLAIDLAALGHHDEAVEAGRESVARYRILAEAQPDAFRGELAMSLNTQANQLADTGDPHGALTLAEEAAGIYRELDEASPGVFAMDLAMGLTTLASRLDDVGRHQEAVERIEEAVTIYRSRPAKHSEVVRPDLAACLNNLGVHLRALGRAEEALAGITEAVEISRGLARTNPRAFRPALSRYLIHRVLCLRDLGRLPEAVPIVREAVAVELQVAAAAPLARLPESASRLSSLSGALTLAGQRHDAPGVTKEVAKLRHRLAKDDPQTHEPEQAATLDLLGRQLASVQRHAEALAAARKAVTVRRRIRARADTPAHRAALAASLGNLGEYLMQAGQRGKALPPMKQAVRLWCELSEADRTAHQPVPALALVLLGFLFFGAGRVDEAVRTAQESVDACDALAGLDPAHGPFLSVALCVHGVILTELEQRAAALPLLERAVQAARPLAETGPAPYRTILASALSGLAQCLAEEPEWPEEALTYAQEAVALLTPPAEADPLVLEADLARALPVLGLCLARAGRHGEAAGTTERAVEVWRRLRDAAPAAHELDFGAALLAYARARLLAGARSAEALAAVDEALAVFRGLGATEPTLVERQQRLALETRTKLIRRST
ncbi:tetratricopeptide repeat protein [Kitasatospora sp. NPDC088548]|uniref:tetratricopeptide repeat protein n=1 Tax=Kitasatospora sp. NPDC088548 TaxID=3364075 RepID=UPI0038133475